MGGKFAEIMRKEKIEADSAPPYTPELNGLAERFNKTIQRTIRALMCDFGLPATMWELAAETAVNTYNITPHKSIRYQVPLVMISPKSRCHLEQVKRFGCIAYIKLPKTETKFSNVSIKTVLVGHTPTGYLLWHPSSRKFLESRHVRFLEKLVYKDVYIKEQNEMQSTEETKEVTSSTEELDFLSSNANPVDDSESAGESAVMGKPDVIQARKRGRPKKSDSEKYKILSNQDKDKEAEEKRDQAEGPLTRSRAKKIDDVSLARYTQVFGAQGAQDDESGYVLLASVCKDPITYDEALQSQDKEFWKDAIKEELQSMNENNVWDIVSRPKTKNNMKRANIIDSRWIFKKKMDTEGKVKYKARLVIRGFKDKNAYDLKETYAPVSRLSLIRATIAIINKEDLEMCQMDVKTAFLNGELTEEIFMEIPEGLEISPEIKQNNVCKLNRSLYGLKISPKKWNKRFSEEAHKIGLENDLHDPCLFTWRHKGKLAIVILYVDDMLIASNDIKKLREIKNHLSREFQMKDLGEPKNFLGMNIQRNRDQRQIIIHQADYTEKILERFKMHECKPQNTPMVTRQVENRNKKTRMSQEETHKNKELKRVPYREAIGSLMYLANATRPDIAYAVNYLARKQLDPTEDDWNDVKRIFRYLRGTANYGIKFALKSESLEALTDASFRDCEDSTSTGGYVIRLYGDTIAWRSHKQSYVTLSTCQAEYLALSDACQELISLDKSIRYIIGKTLFPVTIWCDNRSSRDCTEMDGSHKLKTFDQSLRDIQAELE